jgi:dipeptidyl aminopeptidase/acylaminoacyl peptidase
MSATCAAAEESWHLPSTAAVVHEEVRFANGGAQLVGTLYYPAGGRHLPAVVVEHASAMPTRDYRLYMHLAEALPAMGIAVLVYDRRGSGASTGKPFDAGFETLADDAIAGQLAIARNPRIDAKRIGFWGLSQGGWLAVLAANRSKTAAFAISVSAPLVTPDVQMNYATRNILTLRGYSEQDVKLALDARKANDAYTRGQLARAEAVKALDLARVPVLFIYGGADPWVPVPESVQRLKTLMPAHPNFEYHVIGAANHTMERLAKEEMAFDPATLKAEAPDTPEYFVVLADWLTRKVR